MALFGYLAKEGAEGLLKGVGSLARDIRTAVTGKDILTAAQTTELKIKAMELEEAVLSADAEIAKGQIEINKVEAAASGLYKGGWRPGLGWVCVFAFAYMYVLKPILPWLANLFGADVQQMPDVNVVELMPLLFGILGLGGFRTFEKVKGLK